MRMNPTVLAVPDDSCEFDGKAKGSWISKLSNEVVGMINALKRHAKWAYYTYEEYPNVTRFRTLICLERHAPVFVSGAVAEDKRADIGN